MKFQPGKSFDADALLANFYYRSEDPRLSILKAHLAIEDILRAYVAKCVAHPEALANSRLSFGQVLALSKALCRHIDPEFWMWDAINRLNKLRNAMAHEDGAADLANDVEAFKQFWERQAGPVPPMFQKSPIINITGGPSGGGTITVLDFIAYTLCQMIATYLGVKMENFSMDPKHDEARNALLDGKLYLANTPVKRP